MRRVYIDENLSPALVPPLSAVYRRDIQFRSWDQEGQRGVLDLDLIPHLGACGFDLIVTKDRAQVDANPDERSALVAAGLSWVGIPEVAVGGARLIAQQIAIVAPAIGKIMSRWPQRPTAYHLSPIHDEFAAVEPL